MEFRDYFRSARAHWKLITALFMLAMVVAGAVTWLTKPVYEATTQLFVSTPTQDTSAAYAGNLFSQQRVASYTELLGGTEVARRVIATEHLNTTPERLNEQVKTTVVPNTVILNVSVLAGSPQQAQRLANVFAAELANLITGIETPQGQDVSPVKVTIVRHAELSDSPVEPKPLRNLSIAGLLGLLAGLGLAALRDILDNTVKNAEQITQLTGSSIIGTIVRDHTLATGSLVTDSVATSPAAEGFRQVRTNLQFLSVHEPPRTLVVTSPFGNEGKTTIALNLAIVLAQSGNRVALVEADLRHHTGLAHSLGLAGGAGLTTVLAGTADLDESMQPWGPDGLSILPAGPTPPNPSELLDTVLMRSVIAELRGCHDYVVIDSPPLLPVTDAAVLSKAADGAVMVARYAGTRLQQLRRAMADLQIIDVRVLGVILNMVPVNTDSGYQYRYAYAAASTPSIAGVNGNGAGQLKASRRTPRVGS